MPDYDCTIYGHQWTDSEACVFCGALYGGLAGGDHVPHGSGSNDSIRQPTAIGERPMPCTCGPGMACSTCGGQNDA